MDISTCISTWLKDWAIPLSAGATFLLAVAAFWTICQNRRMQQKEFKIRMLDKIVEWVTDIEKVSLEISIPITDASLSKEQGRKIEANTLLRYGIPFIRNDYIKAIAREAFKEELQQDVDNMIKVFAAFLFCKGKSFGIEDIKNAFRGTALKTTEEVEERLKGKTLQELLDEYSVEKSKYAHVILIKVGYIIASL